MSKLQKKVMDLLTYFLVLVIGPSCNPLAHNASTDSAFNPGDFSTPVAATPTPTPSPTPAPPATHAYTQTRVITIDHTKAGTADSANFPFLFSGTYSFLANLAHGGVVTSPNAYDLIFTSDAQCTLKLSGWEIESYDGSTGSVNIWVKVQNLSATADTLIYLCAGNSNISTFQGSAGSTWDNHYVGVWHMSDNAANTTISDSVGLNNGTNAANTNTKSVSGQIGNAILYNGSTDGTDLGNIMNYVDSAAAFTLELWINFNSVVLYPTIVELNDSGGNNWELFASNMAGYLGVAFGSQFGWAKGYTNTSPPVATWHHWVATYDGGGQGTIGHFTLYQDGVAQSLSAPSPYGGHPNHSYFGRDDSNFLDGNLDEIRISNTERSQSWVTASYNNQGSPSTFYSVGSSLY